MTTPDLEAVITAGEVTDVGTMVYYTCPACGAATGSLQFPDKTGQCQKCGAEARLFSASERESRLPRRNITLQMLVWIVVLVAPFYTIAGSLLIIAWLRRPGIDSILFTYAILMCFESLLLWAVTRPGKARFSGRWALYAAFGLSTLVAPPAMLAYALWKTGAH